MAGILTRRGAVRVLAGAVLLGVAGALAGPVAAGAAGLPPGVAAPLMRGATDRGSSPITLRISAGY